MPPASCVFVLQANILIEQNVFVFFAGRIDNISQRKGGTNIGFAIAAGTNETTNNGRPNVAKLLIVLTDGRSENNEAEESRKARCSTVGEIMEKNKSQSQTVRLMLLVGLQEIGINREQREQS